MTDPIQITDPPATPAAPMPAPAHTCTCGQHDEDTPVLDVRAIPHAVRHAAILGAFDAIAPGGAIVLVAPHAPVPMLAQMADRAPVDVQYLLEGPTEWHVKVTKKAG